MSLAPPANHASASLYAGNLSPDVTEAMLFEIFNQVGPVASIRVCRDAVTRRSLGYAYINFHNVVDAERALDTLAYAHIKDRPLPLRIMWSQRDPALRKSGLGNIFIKNLDPMITVKSLHDTFSAFGNILSCKVVTDEGGNSRGYGYVHYESREAADTAIAKVNGMLLNGKKVYVGHHVSKKARESKSELMKKNFMNVYVKNLDENMTDAELNRLFAQFGEITSSTVMRDSNGKSRGFGFVNFSTHEAASKAVTGLNESSIGEKPIFVGRAQKKSERSEELGKKFEQLKNERLNKYHGVNLYIKNLDDTVDDDKLREEFTAFGTITSAKIARDNDKGNSKGFGFVCFSSSEEATKAVTELNGKMLGGKPIYVALAQRKDVRKQQLEAQYAQRAQFRVAQQGGGLVNPMYGPSPVYYTPNQMPGPRGGQNQYMFPQQMSPVRPRWTPGAQQQQQGRPSGYAAGGVPGGSFPAGPGRQNRARASPGANQQGRPAPQGPGSQGPGQEQRRNFKYSAGVRNQNRDQPLGGPGQPMRQQNMAAVPAPEALTAASLAALPPDRQKQMLGERIFMMVQQREPGLAGKITGMLLEMDNSELLHLLESVESLNAKVDEALSVLRAHNALPPDTEEKKKE